MKSILIVFVCIFLFISLSSAANYFVSASGGNDNNPGSRDEPFKTIQKAADMAVAGDTCFIQRGDYRELVTLKNSGSKDKPICFMAMPNHKVKLSGAEIVQANWVGYFDYDRTWTEQGEKTFQSQGINGKKEYKELYLDGAKMIKVNGPKELSGPNKWFAQWREDDGEFRTTLVMWTPDTETVDGMEATYNNPLNYTIEGKVRDYSLVAKNISHIELKGITFFASTYKFDNCKNCQVVVN